MFGTRQVQDSQTRANGVRRWGRDWTGLKSFNQPELTTDRTAARVAVADGEPGDIVLIQIGPDLIVIHDDEFHFTSPQISVSDLAPSWLPLGNKPEVTDLVGCGARLAYVRTKTGEVIEIDPLLALKHSNLGMVLDRKVTKDEIEEWQRARSRPNLPVVLHPGSEAKSAASSSGRRSPRPEPRQPGRV